MDSTGTYDRSAPLNDQGHTSLTLCGIQTPGPHLAPLYEFERPSDVNSHPSLPRISNPNGLSN